MRWSILGPAFLGGIGFGVGLAYLRPERLGTPWMLLALMLTLGALLAVRRLSRSGPMERELAASPQFDAGAAPPLGQMLISYGLISESDLNRALKRQAGTKKRLGRILVEMGMVTHEQVAQVLEEQLSRREHRLLWGRGEVLVR